MTPPEHRVALLQLARESIKARILRTPAPAEDVCESASAPGAAFVTLHRRGQLRGCIGHLEFDQPLGTVIARMAVAAATTDPRFPPVTAEEISELTIELSLLGGLEPVASVEEIEVGRHGLIIERGWQRGLLLPQVATEWGWDREMFLAQTCHKAGLPRDAWKTGATIHRFEAEVFSELRALTTMDTEDTENR